MFPKVDIEEFDTDMQKCVIKCTWEANNEQRKAEEKKAMDEASEEVKENEDENIKNLYDTKLKKLKFINLKPTDFKNNKRVIIPEAENDIEEIRRNNLKSELRQVVVKYQNENCDKSGNVLENNLTDVQI